MKLKFGYKPLTDTLITAKRLPQNPAACNYLALGFSISLERRHLHHIPRNLSGQERFFPGTFTSATQSPGFVFPKKKGKANIN